MFYCVLKESCNMDFTNDLSFFHFKQLKIFLHPEVYEPSEDTFLMLDTILVDPKKTILEIGAGTGIISLYSANQGANVVCSDINPYAIKLITKNIQENKNQLLGSIQVRKGDLFNIIESNEQFDIILFNPPYLPTLKEHIRGISPWYAQSFDGGPSGHLVIKRFLTKINKYLKIQGFAYFISSNISNIEELNQILNNLPLKNTIIKQLRCDEEILSVHQITI